MATSFPPALLPRSTTPRTTYAVNLAYEEQTYASQQFEQQHPSNGMFSSFALSAPWVVPGASIPFGSSY